MLLYDGTYFRSEKNRGVYWVASHCPTDNFREDYVKSLNDFIEGQLIQKGIFFCANFSKNIHTKVGD